MVAKLLRPFSGKPSLSHRAKGNAMNYSDTDVTGFCVRCYLQILSSLLMDVVPSQALFVFSFSLVAE